MKQIIITTLILTFFVFTGIQKTGGQVNSDKAALEAEIGKVLRDYYDAISRRDAGAAAAVLADDGFSYESGSGYKDNIQNKAEIRAYLQAPMSASSKDSFEIEDLRIIFVSKDVAMANYTVITKSVSNGKNDVWRDRTTNVFVKRAGRWLIAADHTSLISAPLPLVVSGTPVGWIRTPANSSDCYPITVDTNIKHEGKASATIKFACSVENEFGSLAQTIAADDFRGKRVRLSGWLKTENADAAGLWMRVDGNHRLFGFDNMLNRAVRGTTDWKQFEVVLEIPEEAVNIVFGTLISGKGQIWADDFKLEIVGNAVSSTNQLSLEQMSLEDKNRNPKKSDNKQPVNLGFENGIVP